MSLKASSELLPREKLEEKGPECLKDYELLAVILRTGIKGKNVLEVSKHILRLYPPPKLAALNLETLKKIKGVGPAKATALVASFEFAKRAMALGLGQAHVIHSPQDVLPLSGSFRNARKEHFVIVLLNSRHQVISQETITIGILDGSLVHPREVFQSAIEKNAASVICIHNHPSGDPAPSAQDIEVTRRLVQSGRILGIDVLDHVIVTQNSFVSMKEMDDNIKIGFENHV